MKRTFALTFASFAVLAGLAACFTHTTTESEPIGAQSTALLGGGICPPEVPEPPPWVRVMFCNSITVPTDPGLCTSSATLDHCAFFPLERCSQSPAVSGLGTHRVDLTCFDAEQRTYDCHESITVVDEQAPVITCPPAATLGCSGTASLSVSTADNCGSAPVTCIGPNGPFDPASFDVSTFPTGTPTEVICTANDASGNASGCTIPVTRQSGPPVIHLASMPLTLWPPNHKPHILDVLEDCVSSITDACGNAIENPSISILTVTSDEVQDAPGAGHNGDGHTCDDITITGSSVSVLAERNGTSNGRVYSIRFGVTAGGETSHATCSIIVPHDQGNPIPADVDDGCHLCVGDCTGVCEGHTSGPGCVPCATPDPDCDD